MIKSFKHKGLELFFSTGSMKGIQAIHKDRLEVILTTLNTMHNLEPLNAEFMDSNSSGKLENYI